MVWKHKWSSNLILSWYIDWLSDLNAWLTLTHSEKSKISHNHDFSEDSFLDVKECTIPACQRWISTVISITIFRFWISFLSLNIDYFKVCISHTFLDPSLNPQTGTVRFHGCLKASVSAVSIWWFSARMFAECATICYFEHNFSSTAAPESKCMLFYMLHQPIIDSSLSHL